ncbi:Kelch domain-containing protein 2 [Entomortierella chlamydospora]|nr:Kelch domain-containing protein 2 [Entomortierella chlamydospora]
MTFPYSAPWVQLTPGPYASFHSAGLLGTWASSPLQDPPRREQLAAVSRLGDGTMFIFGGMILSSDLLTESSTSELWTLGGYIYNNTSTSNSTSTNSTSSTPTGLSPETAGWQKMASPQVGSAMDRSAHTATLIRSNGLLVIIGGVSSGALASMSEIMVYDTTAGTWSVQTATGATPPLRRNHVAAANSNGQIYIHGGTDLDATTFFADVAILDTTSWQWSQPAIEGNAPTGRYSHAATMVGSNMIITFGLTAGDSTNNIFILDTTSNTWQTSYTPNNLAQTSTNPKDWPGYKPPPVSPTTPSTGTGTPQPQPDVKKSSSIAPIVGGIFGIVTLTAIAVIVVKRHRRRQIIDQQAKFSNLYQSDYANQRQYRLEEAYAPTGMAFDSAPASFGQRMEQLWGNMGAVAFWRGDRRAANRSQSHRLEDQEEDEGMRGLHVGPITDQDIFLDAVHRARSRVGRLSPVFVPLQQPIRPSSPTSPQSPRSPILVSAGIGGPQRYSGVTEYEEIDESTGEHVRSYSDGFENSMQEMDVQMVAVPKGRLYVVNPSDETITQEQNLTK